MCSLSESWRWRVVAAKGQPALHPTIHPPTNNLTLGIDMFVGNSPAVEEVPKRMCVEGSAVSALVLGRPKRRRDSRL